MAYAVAMECNRERKIFMVVGLVGYKNYVLNLSATRLNHGLISAHPLKRPALRDLGSGNDCGLVRTSR